MTALSVKSYMKLNIQEALENLDVRRGYVGLLMSIVA